MHGRKLTCLLLTALALMGLGGNAAAQDRISDKDLQRLMSNMKEDSKKFALSYKQDVSTSTIRKTNEEKNVRQLLDRFPKQVEGMLNQFKSNRQSNALGTIYLSVRQLDEVMKKVPPSTGTTALWSKVKNELDQISKAFNFTPPT